MIELIVNDKKQVFDLIAHAINRIMSMNKVGAYIILNQRLKHDILCNCKFFQYGLSMLNVSPTGELTIFGIPVISTTDIAEDKILIV